jgi:hypothetical protein
MTCWRHFGGRKIRQMAHSARSALDIGGSQMRMGLTIAAAMISLSATAKAQDFSGRWQGAGTAINDQGEMVNCGGVLITIAQTATSFSMSQRFSCDGMETAVPGSPLTIRGDQLISDAGPSGAITGNGFTVTARDGDSLVQSEASFTGKVLELSVVIAPSAAPASPAMKVRASLMRGPASTLQPEARHLAMQ